MTTGIKPATDEEIAAYRMLVLSEGRHGTNCEHWSCADIIKLIARIDSDRAKIAALETTQEELVNALRDARTVVNHCVEYDSGIRSTATAVQRIINHAILRAKQAAEQGKGESK